MKYQRPPVGTSYMIPRYTRLHYKNLYNGTLKESYMKYLPPPGDNALTKEPADSGHQIELTVERNPFLLNLSIYLPRIMNWDTQHEMRIDLLRF